MSWQRFLFNSAQFTFLCLLIMKSTLSTAAISNDLLSAKPVGSWLLSLKTGPLEWKQGEDIDNTGITLGYRLPEFEYGTISLEVDFVSSTGGGEISVDAFGNPVTAEASFQAYSGSAVYRSPGKVFAKGKMGYSQRELDIEFADFPEFNSTISDSAFSTGAGVGLRLGSSFELELEYTSYEQEQNLISLALNWQFGERHRQHVATKEKQKVEKLYPRPKPKEKTVSKKSKQQSQPATIEPMVIKRYPAPADKKPAQQAPTEQNLPFGRSAYTAERTVRANACRKPVLQTKRNNWPYELYRALCQDGSTRTVTCEWGQCKVIK